MATNFFSMPSSSALLLFSFAFGLTNARPWHGATKTAVYQEDDWSPRPTQMIVNPRELFSRDHVDVAVCGWIGGNSASPAACGTGSSCVHDTLHGYIGCCATSGPCTAGVYTSCVDQSSANWGEDSGLVDTGIQTCPSGSYCYLNAYPGGYSQYSCGFSDQATTVEMSFTGQPSDLLLQIVYTGVKFSPSAAPPSSTSSSTSSSSRSQSSSQSSSSQTTPQTSSTRSSASSSSTSSTSTKYSSTSSPTPNSVAAGVATTTTAAASHSSSNTKAIIGGVVGGLAALTAIVGVLLFLLQRRQTHRSQQRAGSFVSSLHNGQIPPNGPFQRIALNSPDDFQSSMTEREQPTPSMIAATVANNYLTTPELAAQSVFSSNGVGEERGYHEDALLVASEIDDFARGFNEVARHHQPHYQDREPEYHFKTPGFERPFLTPPHQFAGMDPGPLELIPSNEVIATSTATRVELRRGGSGGSERDRQRERDMLMGENKDDEEGSSQLSTSGRGFGSANVREVGWRSSQELRPSPPRSVESNSRAGSGLQRYQLVDEVPTEGVQILRTPGQLRGTRPVRGRNSP